MARQSLIESRRRASEALGTTPIGASRVLLAAVIERSPPTPRTAAVAVVFADFSRLLRVEFSFGDATVKLSVQNFVVLSILGSLVGIGLFAYPSFAEDTGIDFWNIDEYQSRMRSDEERYREMDRKDKIVLERTLRKVEIAQELVAGLCTFDQAVDQFETINRTMPTGMPPATEERGRTEREKAAYRVIRYVRTLGMPEAKSLAEELECKLTAKQ